MRPTLWDQAESVSGFTSHTPRVQAESATGFGHRIRSSSLALKESQETVAHSSASSVIKILPPASAMLWRPTAYERCERTYPDRSYVGGGA